MERLETISELLTSRGILRSRGSGLTDPEGIRTADYRSWLPSYTCRGCVAPLHASSSSEPGPEAVALARSVGLVSSSPSMLPALFLIEAPLI